MKRRALDGVTVLSARCRNGLQARLFCEENPTISRSAIDMTLAKVLTATQVVGAGVDAGLDVSVHGVRRVAACSHFARGSLGGNWFAWFCSTSARQFSPGRFKHFSPATNNRTRTRSNCCSGEITPDTSSTCFRSALRGRTNRGAMSLRQRGESGCADRRQQKY